ncbi:thioredoxin domain-containing protein [Luteolibacter sp. LG18]|uniref:thioredoxin family protein n=1 Tax=Luteolibacter sp. LG18 TaxID=2819286 RepID=UPI002B2A653C|nr:hypothetical protein llg_12610 [Luteolibacter sp. LG18]
MIRSRTVFTVLLLAALLPLTGCDGKKEAGKPGGLSGLLDKLKGKQADTAAVTPPMGPLPPLIVQDIVEAEFPNFIDRRDKLCVLAIYDMYGPETADTLKQREIERKVEEEMAKYSDVAVLGRLDIQKCKLFSKTTGAPGVVGTTFYLDGKDVEAFNGTIQVEQLRPILARLVEPLRAKLRASAPAKPVPIPMKEMAESEYPALIATRNKLVLVVYHAEWCGPCKMLKPVLEQMTTEFPGQVVIGRFNVDQCKGLAAKNGVSGIPDVRFFLNGKQVDSFTGYAPAETVRAKCKLLTAGLEPEIPATPATSPEASVTRMKKDWMPPGMEKTRKN